MDKEKNNQPPTKVTKTWFIERGDGKIIAMSELEAWNTLSNRSEWRRNDFKIVGVSDGQTYVKTLKSANDEKEKTEAVIKEKSVELTRYLNTLDKFKFEQLLDDTDDKVIKVKGLIKNLEDEIDELNKQFAKGYQDIVDKAFKAEFKKAKGHIEFPTNQDIMTPKGDREKILSSMPR